MYVQGFEIWLQLISEIFPELAERIFFASDDDEFTNMTRYDVLEKDSDQKLSLIQYYHAYLFCSNIIIREHMFV